MPNGSSQRCLVLSEEIIVTGARNKVPQVSGFRNCAKLKKIVLAGSCKLSKGPCMRDPVTCYDVMS